jgi:hypothetical protein
LDTEPTEEELNKLQEAVASLADSISGGIKPNKAALDEIIVKVHLNNNHDWILAILERACPILERAHNDIHGAEKNRIIEELEVLGMKKFPAILTYDKTKPKPPSAEPDFIDFGHIKPGNESNRTFRVTGGTILDVTFCELNKLKDLGCAMVVKNENSRDYDLKIIGISMAIRWLVAKDGSTLIRTSVIGSLDGKSLDDYIKVVTNNGALIIVPIAVKIDKLELARCCQCGKHSDNLISLNSIGNELKIRIKGPLVENRQFICPTCLDQMKETAIRPKEPPLLSWCPDCGPDHPDKKSLFYNKYAKRYECFRCKHEFSHPNKRVDDYNDRHP